MIIPEVREEAREQKLVGIDNISMSSLLKEESAIVSRFK